MIDVVCELMNKYLMTIRLYLTILLDFMFIIGNLFNLVEKERQKVVKTMLKEDGLRK